MPDKPILIIHPNDRTTNFLSKIKSHLIKTFDNQIHHFNIYPNDESHDQCLERISKHPENGLIIFLGHGRSDKLYGSRGNLYHNLNFVSHEAIQEEPDSYYNNDDFINSENADIFLGKNVFCLACNSNDKIAKFSIEKGAKAFLGFGDIPTSIEEFKDNGIVNVSGDMVRMMKTELNYIIKKSLEHGISNHHTFEQLHNLIRFVTNQRITDILVTRKDVRERHVLTDYLYYLKKNIVIRGDKKIKLYTSFNA